MPHRTRPHVTRPRRTARADAAEGGRRAPLALPRTTQRSDDLQELLYPYNGVGHPHQLGVTPFPCSDGDCGARSRLALVLEVRGLAGVPRPSCPPAPMAPRLDEGRSYADIELPPREEEEEIRWRRSPVDELGRIEPREAPACACRMYRKPEGDPAGGSAIWAFLRCASLAPRSRVLMRGISDISRDDARRR